MTVPSERVGVARVPAGLTPVASLLHKVNAVLAVASGIAIGIAACVLTWEATARYLFKIPSDWQDEIAIFLLVGATFLAAGWVQEARGHVGIQALAAVLSPRLDAMRRYVSDFVTFAFCGFFAWKTWTLLIEAVHDGQTSNSAFGAPLWIPYGAMALGSTVLALQVLLQVLARQTLSIEKE
jgi:TRAP-type C4-dicarboxylate transport system permease small subunit